MTQQPSFETTLLTKREIFACRALQGILTGVTDNSCLFNFGGRKQHSQKIAEFAVELADALIESLEETREVENNVSE